MSLTLSLPSRPMTLTASSSIARQKGHSLTTTSAPVERASSILWTLSLFTRFTSYQ